MWSSRPSRVRKASRCATNSCTFIADGARPDGNTPQPDELSERQELVWSTEAIGGYAPRDNDESRDSVTAEVDSVRFESGELSRDGSARLVIDAHDKQFVWLSLIVDPERRHAPTPHNGTRAKP
jgi:hypothetical protein